MRLSDLAPKWLTFLNLGDGVDFRLGLTFLCPHCKVQRIGVMFDPPIDPAGWLAKGILWQKPSLFWNRTGDTFDTLTLTPSIDVSQFGHWHGSIVNGEVG